MTIHHPLRRSRHPAAMGPRPRSLVVGAVVLVAVLWSAGTASSSQPAHAPAVVRGAVESSGAATVPGPWHVEHPSKGVYRITVAAERTTLEVPLWDGVADVTVIPLGRGANEVRFSHDRSRVDTAFAFVALSHR
jgi:hypothetical protein